MQLVVKTRNRRAHRLALGVMAQGVDETIAYKVKCKAFNKHNLGQNDRPWESREHF